MNRIDPKDWWRMRPGSDGLTLIDEPMVHEWYRCNIWHVRGRDRDMMVDSGMGVVSLRDWVPLVTERPLEAVASHTHFDHIGCHHEFPCRSCHAAEAHLLRAPTRQNTWADKYVTDAIFETLPPEPYRSDTYTIAPAPATRLLWDGDVIDLGDRRFEVIHTPGHSPGGIALWEAATGILITGDIIYDGELIEGESPLEQAQYRTSLERLARLPVRVVHGGHFASFSGERLRGMVADWLRAKDAQAGRG
ncbi:MAG: MBL fold metallo-hydrolase [Paracoccaceae bacterium]|nr:MAG: MBL fold metallo-hydrolase [Paracoccaceae bacterium]